MYALNLALEMQERGHEVAVLTRSPGPPAGEAADFSVSEDGFRGLRVLRLTNRLELRRFRESYRDERVEEAFRAVVRREAPDLIHFHHLLHLSAGLVGVAREAGLPTVITCHDYWALCGRVQLIQPDGTRCERNRGFGCLACLFRRGGVDRAERWLPALSPLVRVAGGAIAALGSPRLPRRWIDKFRDVEERQDYVLRMYAAADLLVSPSRFLRDKMLDTGRFDPSRFVHLDYGFPLEDVDGSGSPPAAGRIRFGFVGSLVWYKGLDVLIEAMNRIDDERAVLNVYGHFDPEGDAYHARLQASVRASGVHFHGLLPNDRISAAYRAIDVLVVPSVWFENSPLTIHEAQLRGIPVLTGDIGGMAELVEDEATGLLFRVGDAEDLAAKLERFLSEPELLGKLSAERAPVMSIEENARALEAHYRELTS